jgi:hypothetical protein
LFSAGEGSQVDDLQVAYSHRLVLTGTQGVNSLDFADFIESGDAGDKDGAGAQAFLEAVQTLRPANPSPEPQGADLDRKAVPLLR